MNFQPIIKILFPFRKPSDPMDLLLVFSILIFVFLILNAFLLVKRMKAAPGTPLGKGVGMVLGLAIGLALWLPLGYITGDQNTGIILGSVIGIGTGIALELWSRKREREVSGP